MSTPSVQTAEHLAAERKFREAAELYRELLKLEENAKNTDLWCALGKALMQDQQFYDAIDAFGTATDLEPENPAFMAALGNALAEVHQYEEAKLWFEKAAGLEDNITYLLKAGDMLAYLGKHDEALVYYTLLSSKYPENADLLHRKAKILRHLKRESDSMETIVEEIRLRKEEVQRSPTAVSYAKLAAAYKRISLWQEAAEMYAQAVTLDPTNPGYHMFLGSALITNGKTDEGVAEYEKAANLSYEDFPSLMRVAESATKFGQYDEAIRLYTRALAVRNINGDAWVGIAYALLMMKNAADAQAFFEMAKATGSMREIPWADKLHKSYKTEALDKAFP
ncbi:tetratricopeptide repeat protein [Methanorbis furvi]|uniref:Beta-barrel assembly-enhancing protease n=1 Tax=Methanorbis furvi TaxID=3028299 RepID=A0AAE4MBQ4_9EURY|nr:Beta-barrel assembly-enhancing protease [Methanocorpusculaceae archaeon Ag1]